MFVTTLLAGCMSGDDLTGAITGERPPGEAAPPDAELDAEVLPDLGVIDADAPDQTAPCPPEVCDGEDDDCDGRVDEGLPRSGDGPICCTPATGEDGAEVALDRRCGEAPPPGLWLDPGWARVAGASGAPDALVLTAPVTLGALCAVEAACSHLRVCRAAAGAPSAPAHGLDLYQIAAFANAWAIASRDPPCYRADGSVLALAGLSDAEARPLHQTGAMGCGARLVSADLYAAVLARVDAGACAAPCDPDRLAAADAEIERSTGLAAWASGWEWAWPGAGVGDPGVSVPLAGCRPTDCVQPVNRPRTPDAEIAAQTSFRLACPVVVGRNPCTAGWGAGGVCR